MSTTAIPQPSFQSYCPNCGKPEHGSLACEFAPGWPEPPKVEITRLDPYFVYERIAAALERIAAGLESNTGRSPDEA